MEKKLKQKYIIMVYGSTGVGKSGFAEKLAKSLISKNMPTQLVNCDIGQFYAPFGIGTAKPDWKNSPLKQYLFDIIDEPVNFNVSRYRELVFDKVNEIWAKNAIPILVGGSGFYLKSLFFPPLDSDLIDKNKDLSDFDGINRLQLWEKLKEIDPDRACKIDKQDIYRIKRALEIWEKTGVKPSEFVPKFDFPCKFLSVFLTRDRKELYDRINMRTEQMVNQGWIEEVENLMGSEWEEFFKQKKLIGYDIIVDYLHGEIGKQKTIEIIQKKTRNYAKRQITFWRSFREQLALRQAQDEREKGKCGFKVETKIETINLTLLDLDLYIKQLVQCLEKLFD